LMQARVLLVAAATLALLAGSDAFSLSKMLMLGNGVNGGTGCAACTIGVGLVDQLAVIHNETVAAVVAKACSWFPEPMQPDCKEIVDKYGPFVIKYLAEHLSPDEACIKMTVCKSPTCQLFPSTSYAKAKHAALNPGPAPELLTMSPWAWIKKEINRVFNTHEPLVDLDDDLFSTEKTLRGSSWRGKDCNDLQKGVYPGRKGDQSEIDNNCNGISGVDSATGKTWEETYCEGTNPLGTVILGDSAAAHFHIPPEYLSPPDMNSTTYSELIYILENEFDWPQQSSTTAFVTTADKYDPGPIDSLYERMVKHNRCNHRDYQNIAVNGARSGSMNSTIVRSISRDQEFDKPALVLYALIGNDVCNGHPDYWNRMTTPQQFYANVVAALDYLDTKLPKGSHLVFVGLPDGRILYDSMHNRTHPIGGGVDYTHVYDFLNCLEISPCYVWMNSNATIRDAGSARAAELSAVYPQIIANHTYKNFDMTYYDYPIAEVIAEWEKKGGHPWDLIEPVDGFHPNQLAMALTAADLWAKLEKDHPTWLGSPNPNNDAILKQFGDQGGY